MVVDSDVLAGTAPPADASSLTPVDGSEGAEHESDVAPETEIVVSAGRSASRTGLWRRILTYGILPGLALIMAMGAGYLKWQDNSFHESQTAAKQSVASATDGAVTLLSYRPDTVEKDLNAARDRLTGNFRDAYWQLVRDVVIPGAKQKQITATATVAGAAPMTASESHATVLVFVDQTITVGNDAPTNTASSLRVTLDKVHDRWLISGFDPV